MAKTKDRIWNFKTDDEFISRLKRASKQVDRPASQIAREAINEKLDELAEKFPQINQSPSNEQTVTA